VRFCRSSQSPFNSLSVSQTSESLSQAATRKRKASGAPIAVLTAHDYPSAKLLEEAGVDWILVGDSLGMVVLGYPDTTRVSLAEMIHHTAAAARGATHTPIIADLPFRSYTSPSQAVDSAQALLLAGAHAVKLEGGIEMVPQISAIATAGIPIMGHIGMLPQSVLLEGGYKKKGKTPEDAQRLVSDAKAIEAAGVFGMVLELVIPEVAGQIRRSVQVPTIGIGSGLDCDGQVLVTSDLAGGFPWFTPKFVTPAANVGECIRNAARAFRESLKN
jgi:3-methyl-2-oxobutanoate hydroxymethyltransferase